MCQWITPVALIALTLSITSLSLAQSNDTSPFTRSSDFDGDGIVGFSDFLLFVEYFGLDHTDETYKARFDLNGNGTIEFSDFLIFVSDFGKTVPLLSDMMNFPLRALHVGGNWGTNTEVVAEWEATGRVGTLIPPDYIEWLKSLQVNWVGLSVALHYDDSMDSTVERVYSSDVRIPTFSDEALRQLIREFRSHGMNVYLTLAFEAFEAEEAARPVYRWQMGNPYAPRWWPDYLILPENWPWSIDHPDHERFVAEFWETYTQQAVHFARIAQEEGVQMYSLGTETDYLFRTRSGNRWPNHFGKELKSMVERVRSVYDGLLTYDMHIDVFRWPHDFGPGSDHLWEDLDLDIIGFSAWFPLTDLRPSTVLSVETFQASYSQIFQNLLVPLTNRNPGRPILFTEYGVIDVVESSQSPGDSSIAEGRRFVFTDLNGNGLDDGRETQANIYQALINTMAQYPEIVNGVFYWNNWMASDEHWAEYWAGRRNYDIRGKLAEEVVRAAYESYRQANP
ncbi:MAG: hypothetical protein OXH16_10790 [Gemmatimonadetes bacterium]|nr:hypothetical protein [Gemmatimonadota bacterium]